ncbi:hypothetical protein [uncultured Actinomyces sp.]|uniref:hypothetical protein n=1 Tax=uncultured Actinomyces sp. TaxID=249061 RepID=UPI00260AA019|nr:hypothetical protein [uncultured Actinomyces sp.]
MNIHIERQLSGAENLDSVDSFGDAGQAEAVERHMSNTVCNSVAEIAEADLGTALLDDGSASALTQCCNDTPARIAVDPITDELQFESQGHPYTCAGDPLDSPAHEGTASVDPSVKTHSVASFSNMEITSGCYEPGFKVVNSTQDDQDASTAFFVGWKKKESSDQKKRARQQSTVFSIMQYRRHPDTGQILLTQEGIDAAIKELENQGVLDKYAMIWQDRCPVEERSEYPEDYPSSTVDLKPVHLHLALILNVRKSIRSVSDLFHIPASRVELGGTAVAIHGESIAGKNSAAQKAFWHLCTYLTHEHFKNLKARDCGKTHKFIYPRAEVRSNFNYSDFLDAGLPGGSGSTSGKSKKLKKILELAVTFDGMTLSEVRTKAPELWTNPGAKAHFEKLRGDYLSHLPAPEQVINFYICGPGGTGKDLLAKALARSLAPETKLPYFKIGGENVSFEGYDGQPVVVWEDFRVADMIRATRGRGTLFRILGPWREAEEAPVVNIKMSKTQLVNRINIVTGPQEYDVFLRGLAGEYTSMRGGIAVRHEAENLSQGFRRFPIIIPVDEREFSIYINLGVLNGTREYQAYEKFEHMRQDLETLRRRCRGIQDVADRIRTIEEIERQTVAPIVEQADRLVNSSDTASMEDVLAEFADSGKSFTPISSTPSTPATSESIEDAGLETATLEEEARRSREANFRTQARKQAEEEDKERRVALAMKGEFPGPDEKFISSRTSEIYFQFLTEMGAQDQDVSLRTLQWTSPWEA